MSTSTDVRKDGQQPDEQDAATDSATRTKALLGLFVALVLGVGGWIGLSRATDSGIARLAAIERGRGTCEAAWGSAQSRADTLVVDRIALADTVDARSAKAFMECGDLRDKGSAGAVPNAREMSGEPMPRGLR